jgi:hypothetical protein
MSGVVQGDLPELGKVVKEYKLSFIRVRELIIIILIGASFASCFLFGAISDTGSGEMVPRIALSFWGLVFSLPVILGIRELFRLRGVSLSLYENGLVYRRRGAVFSTTWDEIDSYIQGTACRIKKKDGQVIEFGLSIQGADEVADEIQEETLQRMLPQVKTAIKKGESVVFKGLQPLEKVPLGKPLDKFARAFSGFTVDADGITEMDGGKRIAWKDVTDYGIAQEKMGRMPVDVFYIKDENTRFRTRYSLLANAHILLALCDEMTGQK